MDVFNQLAEIFMLGAIGGSVPGPVLTAVFTEVINGGFVKSFKVILRALTSEIILAGFILLAVFSMGIPQSFFHFVSLAGAAYLIYLACAIWKIDKIESGQEEIFGFSKMFTLTLLNGAFWIFWLTVCVPRAFALKEQIVGGQFLFLAAFESGWLAMTVLLAYIFSKFRPLLLRKNLVSPVFKFFALMLLFFAARSVYASAIYFLN